MKTFRVISFFSVIVLALSLTSCGVIGKLIKSDPIKQMILATPAGTLEHVDGTEGVQSTQAADSGKLLYADDFSDPNSGWSIYSDDYGTTDYVDGSYQVTAIKEKEYNWGVAGQNFSDVRIDVDVDAVDYNPADENGYGVDCRVQENSDGYGFRIDSVGNVAIEMFNNKETIKLVEWAINDAVFTDGRTNHLTAICNGTSLKFLVNNQQVASVTDTTFSSGDLALSAYSWGTDPITVAFDNLEVHAADNLVQEDAQTLGSLALEISNPTDFTICGMFIVPSTEDFWNDNLLLDGETIAPGASKTFSNLTDSTVDLRAETCDFFTVVEDYNIDLNSTSSYALTAPRLLLHQPFDSADGWPSGLVDGGLVSNNGGYYTVSVSEADKLVTVSSDLSGQDLILFAKGEMVSAGADNMGIYGITCRMRPDGSGIFFAVRGDGMASIIAVTKGQMEQLTDWKGTDYIHAGLENNNIEADCLGSNYTMFVNGDYVGSVDDDRYQNGKVGVAVFSPAGASTLAKFDFMDVYAGE